MSASFQYCPLCTAPLRQGSDGSRERRRCSSSQCAFIDYDNPLPVVAGIVEHEGRVLLVRNVGWPEKWFGLVTGFVERGEEPTAAMLRELDEELGLEGEVVSLVGVYTFVERNELIVAYHVRATGTVRLGSELEAFKAIDPDKLRPWPFGTGLAVRDWLFARSAR